MIIAQAKSKTADDWEDWQVGFGIAQVVLIPVIVGAALVGLKWIFLISASGFAVCSVGFAVVSGLKGWASADRR